MISNSHVFTTHTRRFARGATLAFAIVLTAFGRVEAATINSRTASLVDVLAAVTLAKDGDVVSVPVGTATWTSTLTITKNITLQGAGEGQTVITENLPRATQPPLVSVSLSHDAPASQPYSFRLTGFTFKSATGVAYYGSSDKPMVLVVGKSSYVANPTATTPAPLVLGCVSRVRIDHCTFYQLKATHFIADSVLGVMDHCSFNAIIGYPIKTFMTNWTPTTYKGNTMTKLATKAFGSWADDPYWGTDKFWFFEDCDFYTDPNNGFNVMDNEGGARVVVRHCEFRGGNGGVASHGMEGRAQPGIKQLEFYNNYMALSRLWAQLRSGSALFFNNLSTRMSLGMGLNLYRLDRTYPNFGGAYGQTRYDDNDSSFTPITGTVTATNGTTSLSDSSKNGFPTLDLTDGKVYGITNTTAGKVLASASTYTDPGWGRWGSNVVGIPNATTLSMVAESGNSGHWAVGDTYTIRRMNAIYGQPGQGKGNLLNTTSLNSYYTYTWPATSGPKATYPMAGYPLEPCYSWNNTDDTYGPRGFVNSNGINKSLLAGRDYYNLGTLSTASTASPHNKVGYPARTYAKATDDFPMIGEPGKPNRVQYTPYTYPHPLTLDAAPSPTPASSPIAPSNLRVLPGG